MQCKDCPFKSPSREGDKIGFFCQVNRLSITGMATEDRALAQLDRDCQFPDQSAAIRGYIPKLKAQTLTNLAKLRREMADQEDKLATLELLDAALIASEP